jgi:hypothetical protein
MPVFDLRSIHAAATGVDIMLLIACSIAYMRSATAISAYLKGEKPDAWRSLLRWRMPRWADFYYSNPARVTEERGVSNLILGLQRLDAPDPVCKALLWTARKRLLACFGLFAVAVALIGMRW